MDGSLRSIRSGVGLVLACPEGEVVEYASRFNFPTINNKAEYEVCLAELSIAKELKIGHLTIYSDSRLVVEQVRGEYETREKNMKKYLAKTRKLIELFLEFDIRRIPRIEISKVDSLSKLAALLPSNLQKARTSKFYSGRALKHIDHPTN